jgi:hypothetical protein
MAVKLMPVAPVPGAPVEPAEPVQAEEQQPKQPRKRRRAAVYDADGHEVLITLKCLKCGRMHPLSNFGLRKMADGAIRNQPWCRECRGASSPKKKKGEGEAEHSAEEMAQHAAETVAAEPVPAPVHAPVEPAPAPVDATAIPTLPSGQMQVVPLTAEQVLRALAPQLPRAEPAEVAPEQQPEPKSDEPKPE